MKQTSTEPSSPQESAGTFKPVAGGGETRSGELLLVEGYVFLWLALMAWLLFVWRKQSALHQRLDDLERAIARAETPAADVAKGAPGKGAP